MYLKIHQTSFNCVLQNFKIDADIAIDNTHILKGVVSTGQSDSSYFINGESVMRALPNKNSDNLLYYEKCRAIKFLCFIQKQATYFSLYSTIHNLQHERYIM
jgi:hypothetical protein